jgi:DNA-binding NarL/FixJ family response regulator
MSGKQVIRVLLADDHVVVRAGTRQLLERHPDIEVVGEASNGQEAVELAASLSPDVVVMDIRMPGMGGVEATKKIKTAHPEMAVLVLTAHDDDEYVFALLQAGANGYLLKTAEAEELVKGIRTVIGGQLALAPMVAGKVVSQFTSGKTLPDVLSNIQNDYGGLTEREMDILRLVGKGLTNKEIGRELYISDRTVQAHLSNIFAKLDVSSRTEAVMHAVRQGWISTTR